MGSCVPSKNHKVNVIVLDLDQLSRYPRLGKVIIKSKDSNGKTVGHTNFVFKVTEPLTLISKCILNGDSKYWVSSCMISGLDPRGEFKKNCQDNYLILSNNFAILLALFDGHGSDGDKVSEFCCKFIETYFIEKNLMIAVRIR